MLKQTCRCTSHERILFLGSTKTTWNLATNPHRQSLYSVRTRKFHVTFTRYLTLELQQQRRLDVLPSFQSYCLSPYRSESRSKEKSNSLQEAHNLVIQRVFQTTVHKSPLLNWTSNDGHLHFCISVGPGASFHTKPNKSTQSYLNIFSPNNGPFPSEWTTITNNHWPTYPCIWYNLHFQADWIFQAGLPSTCCK